jgi:pSer/pThr/pTyr-binding forkhead associated (FHA) protein
MTWSLEIYIGKQCFRRLSLDLSEVILGRSRACSIHLPAEVVSRRHARMWISAQMVTLEDLESANGVYVNGKAVSRCVLNDGDRFSIGPYLFILRSSTHLYDYPKVSDSALQEDSPHDKTTHIDLDVVKKIQEQSNPLEETRIEKPSPSNAAKPDKPAEAESPNLSLKFRKPRKP